MEHLASLPAELTRGGGLHDRLIERAYPAFADVPYHQTHAIGRSRRGSLAWRRAVARDYLFHIDRVRPGVRWAERGYVLGMALSARRRRAHVYRLHRRALDWLGEPGVAEAMLRESRVGFVPQGDSQGGEAEAEGRAGELSACTGRSSR